MLEIRTRNDVLKRHVLPYDHFAALSAGGGGVDVVQFLWSTQRSRRLLLVAALFDAAERNRDLCAGQTAPAEARHVLTEAQTRAPADVDALLLDPQVGAWVAYTARRWQNADGATPLRADFGGLCTLAFVAAARAGMDWRTWLPHRDGRVMVFGTGMFVADGLGPDEFVEARTAGGRIILRAGRTEIDVDVSSNVDGDQWWSLRRLRSGADPQLELVLDDVSPLRDLADPVTPWRLSVGEVVKWQAILDDAWALLRDQHPEAVEAIASGVVSLTPLPPGDGLETRSASSGESFGAVLMSPPSDAAMMAVALLHEFQHIKLGALMHLVELTVDDDTALYYAPWRDDPRPITGLLQGVYAFVGIAAFWRRHRQASSGDEARAADFEYAYARSQAHEGIGVLLDSGALTAEGGRFVRGLLARFEPWLSEPVEADALALARLVAGHHRIGWRIRNRAVRPAEVGRLIDRWRNGAPAVVTLDPPTVLAAPPARWSMGMIGLARRSIVDSIGIRSRDGDPAPGEFAGLHSGAAALIEGDAEGALRRYLESLRDDHKDCDAWTGLALALDATGSESAARALRNRPELVRALHVELAEDGEAPEPVRLARWLGVAIDA